MPTITHLTAGVNASGGVQSVAVPSFAVTAGDLLVVSMGCCGSGTGAISFPFWKAVGGGLAWAHFDGSFPWNGTQLSVPSFKGTCCIAWAIATSTGNITDLVVSTDNGQDALGTYYSIEKVTGYNALAPVATYGQYADDSTDGQKDIALLRAPAAGSMVFAAQCQNASDTDLTKAADHGASDGWTEVFQNVGTAWGFTEGQAITGWTNARVRWDDLKPASDTSTHFSFCGAAIEILASGAPAVPSVACVPGQANNNTAASFSVTKPVGARTGDYYVIGAFIRLGGAAVPNPAISGFTRSTVTGISDFHGCFFWKVYDGSEASSFTMTGTALPNYLTCWIVRGAPAGFTPTVPAGVYGATSLTVPAQTKAVDGLMLVQHLGADTGQGPQHYLGQQDLTWTMDGNAFSHGSYHRLNPAAGSMGPYTVLAGNGSGFGVQQLFIEPVTGGSSPQTINAQIATLLFTAVAGTRTAGATTTTAQVATLTFTAIAGTKTVGAVVVTAQVATLTFTALAGTNTVGAVTRSAQVASLTLTAVPGAPFTGSPPQTITAQAANLTFTALAGTSTAGPVTLTAQVATVALTAIPGGVTQSGAVGQTITGQAATLTFTALSGPRTVGPATFAAQVAPLALSGVPGALTPGSVTKTAQIAMLALTALPGTCSSGFTKDAQVATLTLTGRSGTWTAGGTALAGQPALLTLTPLPGRMAVPFAASANDFATELTSQRVEIRVNRADGPWALFVRCPETVLIERPGYYVTNTTAGISWYRNNVLVETVTLAEFAALPGTVELECRGDLCRLRVLGQTVATHDFGDAPLTTDDDHQGFASYGGAGLVIIDAEGGGIPEPVEEDDGRDYLFEDDGPSQSRPLVVAGESERRPLITTGPAQVHRPL